MGTTKSTIGADDWVPVDGFGFADCLPVRDLSHAAEQQELADPKRAAERHEDRRAY
jgi:hypothetical protein